MEVPTASRPPPLTRRDDRFSPELALVCPELRAAALAALPERDPDAFLVRSSNPRERAPEYHLLRSVASDNAGDASEEEVARRTPLPVAIVVYTVQRALMVAAEVAAVLGVVTGALAVMAALHS